MNHLEQLCRPVLLRVCEYWCYAKSGAPMDAGEFRQKIDNDLNEIKLKCEKNPNLNRDFERVERALIFFIDYIIKEGNYPFSRSWVEMARDYNELSGDEKFFDLLSDTLDDPDSSERLKFFYLLMGLGFDGCYHKDPEFLERKMRLCATRFPMENTLHETALFSPKEVELSITRQRGKTLLSLILILAVCFAAGSFAFNYFKFSQATSSFRNSLKHAVEKSRPAYNMSEGRK